MRYYRLTPSTAADDRTVESPALPVFESSLRQPIDEDETLPFRAGLDARRHLIDVTQHV